MNVGEERRMKEVIVPADDLVCLSKDKLQEVIRCKDCKYYTGKWCTKFSTKQFDINDICKDNNDFCSMAERKEECSR